MSTEQSKPPLAPGFYWVLANGRAVVAELAPYGPDRPNYWIWLLPGDSFRCYFFGSDFEVLSPRLEFRGQP